MEYEENGRRLRLSAEVAGQFLHAQFHQRQRFDNTLPVADGVMEIGTHVPFKELKAAMEDWFRRKSYLPKDRRINSHRGRTTPAAIDARSASRQIANCYAYYSP